MLASTARFVATSVAASFAGSRGMEAFGGGGAASAAESASSVKIPGGTTPAGQAATVTGVSPDAACCSMRATSRRLSSATITPSATSNMQAPAAKAQ